MAAHFKDIQDTRALMHYVSNKFVRGDVLDLGAGRAKYKEIFSPRSSSYVALDVSPHTNINVVSDITKTPFSNASFDTIICTQVFEHIPRPWEAAQEIKRLLRHGGIAIVTAPFLQASHADPQDYFRYTIKGMESFFSKPDFSILESGSYNGFYSVLIDFLHMLFFNPYKPARPGTWRLRKLFIKIGVLFDRFCRNKIIYLNSYVIVQKC